MPGTTTRLALPYPQPADPNDVPADIQALADALDLIILPLAGGTMTGALSMAHQVLAQPRLQGARETWVDLGIGGSFTLDLNAANLFSRNVNTAATLSLSNLGPNGVGQFFTLNLVFTGGPHAITWPASFKWNNGTAPTFAANSTNTISGYALNPATGNWFVNALTGHA